MFKVIVLTLFLIECCSSFTKSWHNHDISTLKLLQIVHRHGDRTPAMFAPNDPYKGIEYWPEYPGILTNEGKYRMFKKGQFIRKSYDKYLGDKYSSQEVFDRSSIQERCIQSTSCLLAGAYPPFSKESTWTKNFDAMLGRFWQPFPIMTFMPIEHDDVCTQEATCPALDRERERIYSLPNATQDYEKFKDIYDDLSNITGIPLGGSFGRLVSLAIVDTFNLEMQKGLYWNKMWSKEQEKSIHQRMVEYTTMSMRYYWSSRLAKKLAVGGLITQLNKNIQGVIDAAEKAKGAGSGGDGTGGGNTGGIDAVRNAGKNPNQKKLYVYSTHDSNVQALRNGLNMADDSWPMFGAALLIELHQKSGSDRKEDYFVRVFYHNETIPDTELPQTLQWTDCSSKTDCPVEQYFANTKDLTYEDFNKECV